MDHPCGVLSLSYHQSFQLGMRLAFQAHIILFIISLKLQRILYSDIQSLGLIILDHGAYLLPFHIEKIMQLFFIQFFPFLKLWPSFFNSEVYSSVDVQGLLKPQG